MSSWWTFRAVTHRAWKRTRMVRRLMIQLVMAFGLALLIWLYTRTRDRGTLDQVSIPVQIQLRPNLVDQYDLEVNGSSRVVASFTGPPSRLRELRRQLQRGQVQATFTLGVPEENQNDSSFRGVVRVEAANIPVPPGVVAVLPEQGHTIPYTVYRLVERHLPVKLEYVGDARITQIKLDPPTVKVRGHKEIIDRMWTINTQPYVFPSTADGDGKDSTLRGQASIVTESEGRSLEVTPKNINFSCHLRPRQRTYELTNISVQFLCPPNYPWKPRFATPQAGKIALSVRGPTGEEAPPVLAFVDLSVGNLGPGRNLASVRLQLPRDFQAVSDPLPQVTFYLEPSDRAAAVETDD